MQSVSVTTIPAASPEPSIVTIVVVETGVPFDMTTGNTPSPAFEARAPRLSGEPYNYKPPAWPWGPGISKPSGLDTPTSSEVPKHPWGPGIPTYLPAPVLGVKARQVDSILPEPVAGQIIDSRDVTVSTSAPTLTMHSGRMSESAKDVYSGLGGAVAGAVVIALIGTAVFRCYRGPGKKGDVETGNGSKRPEMSGLK